LDTFSREYTVVPLRSGMLPCRSIFVSLVRSISQGNPWSAVHFCKKIPSTMEEKYQSFSLHLSVTVRPSPIILFLLRSRINGNIVRCGASNHSFGSIRVRHTIPSRRARFPVYLLAGHAHTSFRSSHFFTMHYIFLYFPFIFLATNIGYSAPIVRSTQENNVYTQSCRIHILHLQLGLVHLRLSSHRIFLLQSILPLSCGCFIMQSLIFLNIFAARGTLAQLDLMIWYAVGWAPSSSSSLYSISKLTALPSKLRTRSGGGTGVCARFPNN
jgi:hypothetical protein